MRIHQRAPDFEARTTHGIKSLSDYRGRWLILFSHPGDFTPVCTSEFITFARHFEEFQKRGCDLLALSVDSTFAHIAWLQNIESKFGQEIPFPVIDDSTLKISRAYDMVDADTNDPTTVRSLFVLDPNGLIRAMLSYPSSTGRSVAEILRLLESLQICDHFQVTTPEGWKLGDPVMRHPPVTMEEARSVQKKYAECVDWYFCPMQLPSTPESPKKKTA